MIGDTGDARRKERDPRGDAHEKHAVSRAEGGRRSHQPHHHGYEERDFQGRAGAVHHPRGRCKAGVIYAESEESVSPGRHHRERDAAVPCKIPPAPEKTRACARAGASRRLRPAGEGPFRTALSERLRRPHAQAAAGAVSARHALRSVRTGHGREGRNARAVRTQSGEDAERAFSA